MLRSAFRVINQSTLLLELPALWHVVKTSGTLQLKSIILQALQCFTDVVAEAGVGLTTVLAKGKVRVVASIRNHRL